MDQIIYVGGLNMTINLNEEDIRTLAVACREHAAVVRICRELELSNYTDQSIDRLENISERLLDALNADKK